MMQTFRISDALRCVLLNTPRGPNLASPGNESSQQRALQSLALWKRVLAERDNRITLAWWNGLRLDGLLSARPRAGHRVWEIDHFYLPADAASGSSNGHSRAGLQEAPVLEALEQLVLLAGQRSAERIFFRLPSNNPAIFLAQRTGFFPYLEETLLEGPGGQVLAGEANPVSSFRVRLPEDEYRLFQLFSASTPATVREALGLTFDQWRDAQDPGCKGRQEWMKESNGKIVGWLGLLPHRGATEGRVMVRPDHPHVLLDLVKLALSNPGPQKWLVPDYQGAVYEQLSHRGLQERARYTMLIKTLAVPVLRPGMATVEA